MKLRKKPRKLNGDYLSLNDRLEKKLARKRKLRNRKRRKVKDYYMENLKAIEDVKNINVADLIKDEDIDGANDLLIF